MDPQSLMHVSNFDASGTAAAPHPAPTARDSAISVSPAGMPQLDGMAEAVDFAERRVGAQLDGHAASLAQQ